MTSSADLGLSPRERWGDYFSARPSDLIARLRAVRNDDDWTWSGVLALLEEAADELEAATKRTAEDERRDALAFLDAEAKKFADEGASIRYSVDKRQRLQDKSSIIGTLRAYMQRGDHEGAADR